jgi:hypothetical protein
MNAYDFLRDAAYAQAPNFKGFFGAGGAATIEKEAVAVGKLGAHAKGSSTAVRELFVLAREADAATLRAWPDRRRSLRMRLGLMNTVLIPAAIAWAVAAGMKLFKFRSKRSRSALKAYSNTLGLDA